MTVSANSSPLDPRRRRLLFRAWHRGIREMDLIMGRFAEAHLSDLSEVEVEQFEVLIEVPDRDLFRWITGETETPENYDTPLFQRLKAYHTHDLPIHAA